MIRCRSTSGLPFRRPCVAVFLILVLRTVPTALGTEPDDIPPPCGRPDYCGIWAIWGGEMVSGEGTVVTTNWKHEPRPGEYKSASHRGPSPRSSGEAGAGEKSAPADAIEFEGKTWFTGMADWTVPLRGLTVRPANGARKKNLPEPRGEPSKLLANTAGWWSSIGCIRDRCHQRSFHSY